MNVVIRHQNEVLVKASLEGPLALIGSASHCDAQVGPQFLAPEHLRCKLGSRGIQVEVLASHPRVLRKGRAFRGGAVEDGCLLIVGEVEIRLGLALVTTGTVGRGPTRRGLGSLIAVLVLLVATFIYNRGLNTRGRRLKIPDAPALVTKTQTVACPERSGQQALMAADEFLTTAEAWRERAPFSPGYAVRAVEDYSKAAACLSAAGHKQDASRVEKRRQKFLEGAEFDYRRHQVRLYRAATERDLDGLLRSLHSLSAYLKGREGPYVSWLDEKRRLLTERKRNHGE